MIGLWQTGVGAGRDDFACSFLLHSAGDDIRTSPMDYMRSQLGTKAWSRYFAVAAFAYMSGLMTSSLLSPPSIEQTTTPPESLAMSTMAITDNVVNLSVGAVLGLVHPEYGRKFLGIPYGRAGRFERPREPEPWRPRILNAQSFRATCMRSGVDENMDEDCLHLNVYTPHPLDSERGLISPVIVWFHGGSYTMGAGSDTHAEDVQELVVTRHAIVVTINYRLGVFGFLGSERLRAGPENSTGNYGTLDQQQSLKWVNRHIEAFGGDVQRIAIMGWSAGAASASVHLIMPSSRGLFSRAIMLSGGFTDWAAIPMDKAEQLYDHMLKSTGCDKEEACLSKGPACSCMRNIPAEDLVKHQPGWGWGPTIDGIEVRYHPMVALRSGEVHKDVPIIIGGTIEDTTVDIGDFATDADFFEFVELPKQNQGLGLSKRAAAVAARLYLEEATEDLGRSRAYWAARRAKADTTMNCPARNVARLWNASAGAHAHWYRWETPAPETYGLPEGDRPSRFEIRSCWPCPGASHGDDIPYIFEKPQVNVNSAKAYLADVYQVFLVNFVSAADPNLWHNFALSERSSKGRAWPVAQEGGMRFRAGQIAVDPELLKRKCAFWAQNGY